MVFSRIFPDLKYKRMSDEDFKRELVKEIKRVHEIWRKRRAEIIAVKSFTADKVRHYDLNMGRICEICEGREIKNPFDFKYVYARWKPALIKGKISLIEAIDAGIKETTEGAIKMFGEKLWREV